MMILKIGMLLNKSWIEKKSLASGVSNDYIDEIMMLQFLMEHLRKTNGCWGGFFFFIALQNFIKIKKSLSKIKVWVPFKIDTKELKLF